MKKQEINILNVLFCIMVIFIHASGAVIGGPKDTIAYRGIFPVWNIFSVAVPGFIFLSGLKSGLSNEQITTKNYPNFILKKLKNIYLPYCLWVIVYYVWFVWRGYFPFSATELIKYILNGTLAAHFYFVVTIMQFYILLPLIKKLVKKSSPVVLLILSFVISYFSEKYLSTIIYDVTNVNFIYTDRLFSTYLVYYVLGLICAESYDKILNFEKNKWIVTSSLVLGVLFCLSFGTHYYQALKLAFCISAIPCLLAFSHKISTINFFKTKHFKCINSATYNIYLSHLLIMQIIDAYMISGFSERLLVAFCIRFALLFALSFCVCTFYSYFKELLKEKQ